ncbi:MAG: O-antigen ligase family protein [Propioniciclava sp.]|uniref:O-antigen ligase family protein n=1 Tax=Propioniciclava sp. TaxID=2038686 RepID=UPI0039E39EEA
MTTPARSVSPVAKKKKHPFDAVSLLTIYLVALYAFPSAGAIAAIGSVGRPSTLIGLVCLAWWILATIQRRRPRLGPAQPVRIALAVFLIIALLSYAAAHARGLPPGETTVTDSGLIRLASFAGVALLTMDGIQSKERFLTLLQRVAIGGAATATLGILQFATGEQLLAGVALPGFTSNGFGLEERGDLIRASAMAAHPLEYAAVLGCALPLALNRALFVSTATAAVRWYSSAAILVASLFAVSRSAVLSVVLGVAFLFPSWPKKTRGYLMIAAVFLLGVVYVLVPGMFGTLRSLFAGSDASTNSRLHSWGPALEIWSAHPFIGRGFGTLLPRYRILDNAYLGLLVELGVLGLAAFVALVVAAFVVSLRASRRTADVALRTQTRALTASLSVAALLVALFDAFSFTMAAGTLALIVGLCGASSVVCATSRPASKDTNHGGTVPTS